MNTDQSRDLIRKTTDIKSGLSSLEVQKRIENNQINKVNDPIDESYLKIIFRNTFTFFNVLLVSIAVLFMVVVGPSAIGNIMFLIIMVANILIGTIQEFKSKRKISKLKLITSPKVIVIRNSEEHQILATEVVLDDIIKLGNGDQIPADCTLLEGYIETNESMLTGESDPIKKHEGAFLYGGSFVSSGSCYAIVDKVGSDTYISSIESKAKKFDRPKSKLVTSIMGIIKKLTIVIIPLGVLTFWHTLISTKSNWADAILAGGTTMVGMIPAGMVLLSSVAMAAGVLKTC